MTSANPQQSLLARIARLRILNFSPCLIMDTRNVKLHGQFVAYLSVFEAHVLIGWNYRANTACDIVGRVDEEPAALASRMGNWIPDWFSA